MSGGSAPGEPPRLGRPWSAGWYMPCVRSPPFAAAATRRGFSRTLGGESMAMDSLRDLYVEQLRDLYSAETQILKALPMMAEKASNQELRSAFQEHERVTHDQVRRLETIFDGLGEKPGG